MGRDKTSQELLRNLVDALYQKQAKAEPAERDSCLLAQDGQYLGHITNDIYDPSSILNEYGPYGSSYSSTSIFNPYSIYGSEYGQFSINNPYCATPPQLFIRGQLLGHVSRNQFIAHRIPTDAFIYTLQNDLASLLVGRITESELEARQLEGESFILAGDGTFLGKLNPNQYDNESIFNEYGPYGSQFSPTSIFNSYSLYGGKFSDLSPFNQYSTNPPQIFIRGQFHAFLTTNPVKTPSIDPTTIKEWARSNVGS
jgi:hypothetical protein